MTIGDIIAAIKYSGLMLTCFLNGKFSCLLIFLSWIKATKGAITFILETALDSDGFTLTSALLLTSKSFW
jgi:hypothetical protein